MKAWREKNRYTKEGRMKHILSNDKYRAKLRGHMPCNASLEQLCETLTDICDVCGQKSERPLYLDHNHTTGDFRGWLCNHCNLAIGLMDDSPDRLMLAARYLLDNA
jgi:hypothetical protein